MAMTWVPSIRLLAAMLIGLAAAMTGVAGAAPAAKKPADPGVLTTTMAKPSAQALAAAAKEKAGCTDKCHAPIKAFHDDGKHKTLACSSCHDKTAEHMALAWSTVPHVTQGEKADITNLEQLRQKYAKR